GVAKACGGQTAVGTLVGLTEEAAHAEAFLVTEPFSTDTIAHAIADLVEQILVQAVPVGVFAGGRNRIVLETKVTLSYVRHGFADAIRRAAISNRLQVAEAGLRRGQVGLLAHRHGKRQRR